MASSTPDTAATAIPPRLQGGLNAVAKSKAAYRYAKKTKSNYDGQIERGKKHAAEYGGRFATAFDILDEYTPMMLLIFVCHKCDEKDEFDQNKDKGLVYWHKTAEAIRSAFKQYFEESFGCQGDFWKREESGGFVGNPVFDLEFVNYMKSLKMRDGKARVSKSSLPMSYQDLEKPMVHLQQPTTIAEHGKGVSLFFEAFAATGFTVWTR